MTRNRPVYSNPIPIGTSDVYTGGAGEFVSLRKAGTSSLGTIDQRLLFPPISSSNVDETMIADPYDGQIVMVRSGDNNDDADSAQWDFLASYDGTRSKWLSLQVSTFSWAVNSTTWNSADYLPPVGFDLKANAAFDYRLPFDATVIGMEITQESASGAVTWRIRQGVLNTTVGINTSADYASGFAFSHDFSKGDLMTAFGGGTSGDNVLITAHFKWRFDVAAGI
jgi:hypothetical protein